MSEVTKTVVRYSRDFQGNLSVDPNGSWVLAADAAINAKRLMNHIDRVTADLASANSDKEAYAQNAIDLRKRVDALQQLLIAAGERADSFDRLYTSSLDERDQLQQRADVLQGLLRNQVELLSAMFSSFDDKAYWLPVIVEECKKLSAALKPAEGGGDKAMSFAQIAQFNDDNDHCPEREE